MSLSKRIRHRKGKLYYQVTNSILGEDYTIVERTYTSNRNVTPCILPYTYWVAYDKNGIFMRQRDVSAQDLYDSIESYHAKKLMRVL